MQAKEMQPQLKMVPQQSWQIPFSIGSLHKERQTVQEQQQEFRSTTNEIRKLLHNMKQFSEEDRETLKIWTQGLQKRFGTIKKRYPPTA